MVWRRPRSQRIPIKVTIWLKEIACHSSMDACRRHDIPVSETKDFATHSQNSHCQPLLCSLTLVPALSPTSYSACKNVIWLFRYLDSSPLFLCYADPALKQISKLICLSNKQFLRNDCFSHTFKRFLCCIIYYNVIWYNEEGLVICNKNCKYKTRDSF